MLGDGVASSSLASRSIREDGLEISITMRRNPVAQALAMPARTRQNLGFEAPAMPARTRRNPVVEALAIPAIFPARTRSMRKNGSTGRFRSIFGQGVEILTRRRRNRLVLAVAMPEKDNLAGEFMSFVNQSGFSWPLQHRSPTPLMPPNTVVKTQMDALMRNDYPDEDSGIKTAFDFTLRPMPHQYDKVPVDDKPRARAWDASGRALTYEEFAKYFKRSNYTLMLNCSEWKPVSPVVFKAERRAFQIVQVRCKANEATAEFTFSLQRVRSGAYKDCWMVAGVQPRWQPF